MLDIFNLILNTFYNIIMLFDEFILFNGISLLDFLIGALAFNIIISFLKRGDSNVK